MIFSQLFPSTAKMYINNGTVENYMGTYLLIFHTYSILFGQFQMINFTSQINDIDIVLFFAHCESEMAKKNNIYGDMDMCFISISKRMVVINVNLFFIKYSGGANLLKEKRVVASSYFVSDISRFSFAVSVQQLIAPNETKE